MASFSRLPTGKYRVHFRDPSGRKRSRTVASLAAARALKASLDADARMEIDVDLAKATVHQIAQEWVRQLTVRPTTKGGYRSLYNNWVMPRWGATPVAQVERYQVREWAMSLTDEHGLAASTRNQACIVLRLILDYAVERKALAANPVANLKLPKLPSDVAPVFLSMDDCRRLIDVAPAPWDLAIKVAVFAGVRAGELWGLRVGDIDADRSAVHVNRSISELSNGTLHVGMPKSGKGRVVTVPQWLCKELVAHCADRDPATPIFTDPHGQVVRHHSFFTHRVWYPTRRAAGLDLRFHDLRHTHASLLIETGADIKVVQERLGHASLLTTNRYAHLSTRKDAQVTEALGARFAAD